MGVAEVEKKKMGWDGLIPPRFVFETKRPTKIFDFVLFSFWSVDGVRDDETARAQKKMLALKKIESRERRERKDPPPLCSSKELIEHMSDWTCFPLSHRGNGERNVAGDEAGGLPHEREVQTNSSPRPDRGCQQALL